MRNYKTKVNSKDESKEVQELFFELGYEKGACSWGSYPAVIVTTQDWSTGSYCSTRALGLNIPAHDNYIEITLAELRDMVVLKRNDVNDATHACETKHHRRGYLSSDGIEYIWSYGQNEWFKAKQSFNKYELKPIEETMKEYINKTTGEYRKTTEKVTGEQWVEVDSRYNFAFKKTNGDVRFSESCFNSYFREDLLWHRPTQPEALPFIDDDPTLDKIKIKVDGDLNRAIDIAKSEGYYNCQFNKIPENAYWLLCNEDGKVDYSMNENILNEYMMLHDEPQSLNDQYAEIEQVRQDSKLAQSLSDFKNTDHGKDFDEFDLMSDNVNHPSHYTQGKVECIDALEAATVGKAGIEAVCVANVIKYLWRYEEKNGKEDIKKAQWYLNKLLDSID